MKVLGINGGPRKGKISKTTMLLEAFIEGCQSAGAETNIINLREKDIKQCNGCYSCWVKTPGKCIQKDDMQEILKLHEEVDLLVWATPLYFFGPTSLFKKYLDRTLPVAEPQIALKDGLCTHPCRTGKIPDKVIISVAGFYELDHFGPLSAMFHYMEGRGFGRIKAEIYRPSAEFMSAPQLKEKVEEILEATRQAGREMVELGQIREDTMKAIQQDFMDKESFIKFANQYWEWDMKRWAEKLKKDRQETS
ncbi:MAG: flavodoxin family protein [Chitinophagales bacterium]